MTARDTLLNHASDLVDRLSESRAARRIVYAVRNRRTFADLYQHDRMLADRVRVDAYHAALGEHIEDGDVVVDLGTGTGVLAFFAARSGARVVHAIEHGPMIDAARALARANGIANVDFHHLHSGTFVLDAPADVIVHEQLGDALFDEEVVANVVDLRERVLKPGGKILPAHLELFIEPIQLHEDFRSPYAWQQRDVHGLDFSWLESLRAQQPHSYRYRSFRPIPFSHFLCEPEPVLRVDLHTIAADGLPRSIAYERPAVRDGWLDGFCVYFRAAFDDALSFGTSPAETGTSWATPLLRVASRRVEPGETIRLDLRAGALSQPATWEWADE